MEETELREMIWRVADQCERQVGVFISPSARQALLQQTLPQLGRITSCLPGKPCSQGLENSVRHLVRTVGYRALSEGISVVDAASIHLNRAASLSASTWPGNAGLGLGAS